MRDNDRVFLPVTERSAAPVSAARDGGRARRWAVTFVVGMVLADASIVVLALPAVYREFDTQVGDVAWVITSFTLALAIAAVPAAAAVGRVGAARMCAIGLVGFAGASLACALAGSFGFLVAARAVQGVAGAAAICAALELLPRVSGAEARAARSWAAAGIAGAALGPAIGGALTELLAWQAIFAVQVPFALAPIALIGLRGGRERPDAPAGRPHIAANVALAFLSAGLTAALFLVVLLLIEGWRMSPLAAAAVVSVLPAASILAAPLDARAGDVRVRVAAGGILGAGGLAALGVLPEGDWWWTVPPQILVGVGLVLSLGGLTSAALQGRSRPALHGGVTIASRHAGIVIGLLIVTPVFVADLDRQETRTERRGVALVLDSDISPSTKLELAGTVVADLRGQPGRLPDIRRSFDRVEPGESERDRYDALADRVEGEVDRGAADAFSRSFLIAAALALAGLVPVAFSRKAAL